MNESDGDKVVVTLNWLTLMMTFSPLALSVSMAEKFLMLIE